MAYGKKRKLTPRRLKVAKVYAETGSRKMAAAAAGMSLPGVCQALHDPNVQALIRREQLHKLVVQGVPVAVAALVEIAGNPLAKDSSRVMASKEILSIAKVSPEALTEEALDGATIAELQALLERTKASNAAAAQVIDAEVIELEPTAGALD